MNRGSNIGRQIIGIVCIRERVQSVLFNSRLTSISFNQKQLPFDVMEARRTEASDKRVIWAPTEVKTETRGDPRDAAVRRNLTFRVPRDILV